MISTNFLINGAESNDTGSANAYALIHEPSHVAKNARDAHESAVLKVAQNVATSEMTNGINAATSMLAYFLDIIIMLHVLISC